MRHRRHNPRARHPGARFGLTVQGAQLHLFVLLFASALGTVLGGPVGDRVGRKPLTWASIHRRVRPISQASGAKKATPSKTQPGSSMRCEYMKRQPSPLACTMWCWKTAAEPGTSPA